MSPEVITAIAFGIPSLFIAALSLWVACLTLCLSRTQTHLTTHTTAWLAGMERGSWPGNRESSHSLASLPSSAGYLTHRRDR